VHLKLRGAPNLSGHPSFAAVVDNKDRWGEDGVPHHLSEMRVSVRRYRGGLPDPTEILQPTKCNQLASRIFADLSRMRNLEFE
jgi:hypothetical protein